MERAEEFELTIRIRVLIRIAVWSLRAAGHPTAALPLVAAPVSVAAGLPCVHRALDRIDRTAPLHGAGGPRSRAALALASLRMAAQLVVVVPPTLAVEAIDRLLATLRGAFDGVGPEPWPTVEDERITVGDAL